jgi:predicted enzyme related to lactoylglutathione lyase
MVIKGIKWVGICTADWNQTISFYRDVLGLTLRNEGTFTTEGGQGARWVEMAAANGNLIEAFDQNLPERALFQAPVVGFLVDDVESARSELESKGVKFIGPVGRGTDWEWSYFRSPEGHVYQIMSALKQ